MPDGDQSPFSDLPAALVDEVILCSQDVGKRLLHYPTMTVGCSRC